MVGAIGVLFRMPAGYIVRVLLIATDGATAILAVGVAFIDPLAATQTGAAMVIAIGSYKGLVACEGVIVLLVVADGADVILAVGVVFILGQQAAFAAGGTVAVFICGILPGVFMVLVATDRAGITIHGVPLDNG